MDTPKIENGNFLKKNENFSEDESSNSNPTDFMDYDNEVIATRISDGLFVGNFQACLDYEFLTSNKIRWIINCCGKTVENRFEKKNKNQKNELEQYYKYYGIGINERRYLNYLTFYFSSCSRMTHSHNKEFFGENNENLIKVSNFISKAFKIGECVLVHSIKGNNRSCALIIGYYIYKYKWTLEKAYDFVGISNKNMSISKCYMQQLRDLEDRCLLDQYKNMQDEKTHILLTNTFINTLPTKEKYDFLFTQRNDVDYAEVEQLFSSEEEKQREKPTKKKRKVRFCKFVEEIGPRRKNFGYKNTNPYKKGKYELNSIPFSAPSRKTVRANKNKNIKSILKIKQQDNRLNIIGKEEMKKKEEEKNTLFFQNGENENQKKREIEKRKEKYRRNAKKQILRNLEKKDKRYRRRKKRSKSTSYILGNPKRIKKSNTFEVLNKPTNEKLPELKNGDITIDEGSISLPLDQSRANFKNVIKNETEEEENEKKEEISYVDYLLKSSGNKRKKKKEKTFQHGSSLLTKSLEERELEREKEMKLFYEKHNQSNSLGDERYSSLEIDYRTDNPSGISRRLFSTPKKKPKKLPSLNNSLATKTPAERQSPGCNKKRSRPKFYSKTKSQNIMNNKSIKFSNKFKKRKGNKASLRSIYHKRAPTPVGRRKKDKKGKRRPHSASIEHKSILSVNGRRPKTASSSGSMSIKEVSGGAKKKGKRIFKNISRKRNELINLRENMGIFMN